MFYDIFLDLCENEGKKPGNVADALRINRGTVTSWKKEGYTPRGANLNKLAAYFGVPNDMLLERPPFDHWADIKNDLGGFFRSLDTEDREMLEMFYSIDPDHPENAKLTNIIDFLKESVESAEKIGSNWSVTLKGGFAKEKAPTLTKKDERDIARDLEAIMAELEAGGDMMFDGDPMTPEARESILSAMRLGLEAAKAKNKERFTPHKYRKE